MVLATEKLSERQRALVKKVSTTHGKYIVLQVVKGQVEPIYIVSVVQC